jgi:hypothetical protein
VTQTIGEMQKYTLEVIRVTLGEFKEKQRIDIRTYFQPDADPDNWIPTKKGINISLDSWGEFKDLVEKVDQAIGKKN